MAHIKIIRARTFVRNVQPGHIIHLKEVPAAHIASYVLLDQYHLKVQKIAKHVLQEPIKMQWGKNSVLFVQSGHSKKTQEKTHARNVRQGHIINTLGNPLLLLAFPVQLIRQILQQGSLVVQVVPHIPIALQGPQNVSANIEDLKI
eukprot:TRINITY_DN9757_c0_g1_i1.p5 TRINITY_DN9757_c0_g1~~TRINITY_DN9757_c0_g1_i1.p5  ORF type:complete len:146 (+),score=3.07 TRINITY_DN9757_c0_g1_i1:404-841(+)